MPTSVNPDSARAAVPKHSPHFLFSPSDAKCVCRRATLNHRAHDVADYAITHNLTPFISMQNHYSMIYREEEREMFPTLKVCSPKSPCPAPD